MCPSACTFIHLFPYLFISPSVRYTANPHLFFHPLTHHFSVRLLANYSFINLFIYLSEHLLKLLIKSVMTYTKNFGSGISMRIRRTHLPIFSDQTYMYVSGRRYIAEILPKRRKT